MNFLTQKYIWLLSGGISAFTIAIIMIPFIIRLAKMKNLVDVPNARKEHKNPIPTLGGIAVFAGLFVSILIWLGLDAYREMKYILFSISLLFITGIWDDLKDLSAGKKFVVQIVAAFIVAGSGIRIESLQGLFGIYEIHLLVQYAITILILVGVTNAINLIDGIDGLAGGIVAINAFVFTLLFAFKGQLTFALLSITLAGALVGFLYYNFNPAKVFMGDTGSLVIGFLLATLGTKYLQLDVFSSGTSLTLVFGVLILPVFDTLRVFTLRLLKRKSPFSPDRNHIHHLLVKTGYNHKKSALIMYLANGVLIATSFLLCNSQIPLFTALLLIAALAILLSELLSIKRVLKTNLHLDELMKSKRGKQDKNHLLTNL